MATTCRWPISNRTDRPRRGSWSKAFCRAKNTAELHNLLGQIEEKDGKFVAAANEFEIAAHQDPSESNLFDWASELLLHRTLEPAIEVFRQSARALPEFAADGDRSGHCSVLARQL